MPPIASFAAPRPEAGDASRPALRPWPTTLWLLALLFAAFHELRAELAQAAGDTLSSGALTATALVSIASRAGGQAIEAACYSGWWRLRGRDVRGVWMFAAIVSLSLLDTLAGATARLVAGTSHVWLVPILGLRAVDGALRDAPGLRVAFAHVGLLSLLRVVGTAYAQWQEGVPRAAALRLTFAAWAAGRLVTWWTTDLMRGFGPLG